MKNNVSKCVVCQGAVNSTGDGCISSCPTGEMIDFDTKKCTSTCTKMTSSDGKKCSQKCIFPDVGSDSSKTCLSQCSNG